MCGIAGVASFNHGSTIDPDRFDRMVNTLYHRGPDEAGIGICGNVALGMRRLSIIDLAGGSQPIFNEDRSVRVVFNGEIYNFRELRSRLEAKGHRFATNSDTEVIVHAYEQYGARFPEYLNGMFAIALHDMRKNILVLVRDPIGIKPLYYAFDQNHLVWGSEIKAVLASGLVQRDLDVDSLAEFIAWEYVPAPNTLFRSIQKLEPGAQLAVDLNDPRCEPKRYWHLKPTSTQRSEEEWAAAVDAQLARSTTSQLVSDVPLGAFLSGGVDSSLIVSQMGPAHTFSIGFNDPTYNEAHWASKVAAHLGVSHVQETIEPDALALFDALVPFMDDPIGDFSIFPTYLVSRLAREHVTVVLSGDGGDELFGGYETYVAQFLSQKYQRVPALLRKGLIEPVISSLKPRPAKKGLVNKSLRFVQGLDYAPGLRHARWRAFAGDAELSRLLSPDVQRARRRDVNAHIDHLFEEARDFSPLNQLLYVDLKSYLSDNILTKVDRMSMAVSLEARVPYLDKEMVELAFSVPDELKLSGNQTKVLLKKLAARYVPPECVYRPKQGFSIPIKNWIRDEYRPLVAEYLDPRQLDADGILRGDAVRALVNEHMSGSANHSHVIWCLLMFQAWKRRWNDASI